MKSGLKFNDLNANHAKDVGEPGLSGWEIKLLNATQTAVLATVNTAADGSYSFAGLAPGTYVVCETPQATWNQTFPVPGAGIVACANGTLGYQFTLAFVDNVCQHLDNDFGNNKPSHKSGMKFNDVNGNGVKDPGDAGIAGWPINLYALPANTLVQTVNTNASGNYSFTIPAAGSYRVCEGQKAGVTSTETFPNAGTVHGGETIVNTCPLPNIWGYEFTTTSGTEITENDFGNHPPQQECKKQTVIDIMNATYPGNVGPDVTVHTFNGESVQAAVDAAADIERRRLHHRHGPRPRGRVARRHRQPEGGRIEGLRHGEAIRVVRMQRHDDGRRDRPGDLGQGHGDAASRSRSMAVRRPSS